MKSEINDIKSNTDTNPFSYWDEDGLEYWTKMGSPKKF